MSEQKTAFLSSEGDAWFTRNKQALSVRDAAQDEVLQVIGNLRLAPKFALEVGCADGWRLRGLEALTGAACSGVEPSAQAVAEGLALAPHHALKLGTADALDFADASFDLVIYGFCLTYCDRKDLFKVAMEGDRVLKDGGHMVVYDFYTETAYRNAYAHRPGYYCYKMDYAGLFAWNPAYQRLHHQLSLHGGQAPRHMDEQIGITVLKKDIAAGYPDNPFAR